jgi:hypothetical protein
VNAQTPIAPAADAIDIWRGQFIALFARIEHAVAETLLRMASRNEAGRGSLDANFNVRREKLLDALDTLSAQHNSAKNARKRLEQTRQWCDLRNLVCHGAARVVQCDGDTGMLWLSQPSSHSMATICTGTMLSTQDCARLLDDLRQLANAVGQTLSNVRETLD